MCKASDRAMRISDVRVTHKSGGKSGTYAEDRRGRPEAAQDEAAQDEAGQDEAGQPEATQDEAGQDED
jgi:hypothetical protein